MSLGNVYYDPNHPAIFGSVAKLIKASKNKKKDVEERLSIQNMYNLHKHVRKRFPRNPYTVTNIDDVWEMDLADLSSLAKFNEKRHRHIFTVRLEHASKDKTGASITSALKFLFQNRKPISIQSDKGTEFVNATVQQYLKHHGVSFHTTHNTHKGRCH